MIHEDRGEAAVTLGQRSRDALEVRAKLQDWNPVKPGWLVIFEWFEPRLPSVGSHERHETCRDNPLHERSQRGA